MSAIKQQFNPTNNKIFGSPEKILAASRTLLRLVTFDRLLPFPRLPILERIAKVWMSNANEFEKNRSAVAAQTQFVAQLKNDFPDFDSTLIETLGSLYVTELLSTSTPRISEKHAERFEKDKQSLITAPMLKSNLGDEGPTFLVEYSREASLQSYVIKWTNWNEITCNSIYEAFSTFLAELSTDLTFYVPRAVALDFKRHIHQLYTGKQVQLDHHVSDELRTSFLKILKIYNTPLTPKAQELMLEEKVPGHDLLVFARKRYKELTTPQKEKFFRQLAGLSMIDLLMGHNDRIVHIEYDNVLALPTDWSTLSELLQANLGNALVSWPTHEPDPILFAIDNGVELPLVTPPNKQRHLSFLQTLFSSPRFEELIGKNMRASILKAVKQFIQETENDPDFAKDLTKIREELSVFTHDIEHDQNVLIAFTAGIQQMRGIIKDKMIPFLQSDRFKILAQFVDTNFLETARLL